MKTFPAAIALLILALAFSLPLTESLAAADPATQPAAASTAPATQAATEPTTRHVATTPPGFDVVTADGQTVFCPPADDAWVKKALGQLTPASRPTTMPSNLESAIQQRRAELKKEMAADLLITDGKAVDQLIDQQILDNLHSLEALKPPVIYLLATRQQIISALGAGWTDPRYHYSRYAHDMEYDHEVSLVTGNQKGDDDVMWVEVQDGDSPDKQSQLLRDRIHNFQTSVDQLCSSLSESTTRNLIAAFIGKVDFVPLKLSSSTLWLATGVANVYGVKYLALLEDGSRQAMTAALIRGNPSNPLPWPPLNLVDPLDPSSMRPQLVGYYDEALLHKSCYVVEKWIEQGGDGAIAKALPLMRQNPPQNPQELIELARTATGVDLTVFMQPHYGPINP